ncbi:MAG: 8-oxo-dGTP diphosphatase [Acholeplasmataceae bacterium]|nr:8-oxo-dGTP diphosphatase [Acholeplasmataceae bacterium]
MHKYTLGFIKRNDEILMVNREKSPWKGSWNGVGGKIDADESALTCIIREIAEETNIIVEHHQIKDKGILTWNDFAALGNGLHLFLIEIPKDYVYETPRKVREGILDWKKIEWINDFENYGVSHNIPYFLPTILNEEKRYHFHCTFENKHLKSVSKEWIEE